MRTEGKGLVLGYKHLMNDVLLAAVRFDTCWLGVIFRRRGR